MSHLTSDERPHLDNSSVTFLMINPWTGWAPPQWQQGIGPVIVARLDKKPLSIDALEVIWMFCDASGELAAEGDLSRAELEARYKPTAFQKCIALGSQSLGTSLSALATSELAEGLKMEPPESGESEPKRGFAQRLPPELCEMVLSESLPRNAWNFRRVCRRWNGYVLGTLAPKRWLQGTSIYVRGPQSWIFFHAAKEGLEDDELPSNAKRRSSSGSSSGVGCGGAFSPALLAVTDSNYSHLTRFDFTRLVGADVAQFEPASVPLHPTHLRELIMKLEDEVQVIFQLSTTGVVETFKHAVVNSLSLAERTRPTLTLRWRELFTRTIASRPLSGDWVPLGMRTLLRTDSPSVLWVADGKEGSPGRWFSARNNEPMSPETERQAPNHVRDRSKGRQQGKGVGRIASRDLEDDECAGSDGYDADVENGGPPSDSELFDGSMADWG